MDSGAVLVYLHGGFCDHLVRLGEPENLDFIANGLEWIRAKKLPAGLGAHDQSRIGGRDFHVPRIDFSSVDFLVKIKQNQVCCGCCFSEPRIKETQSSSQQQSIAFLHKTSGESAIGSFDKPEGRSQVLKRTQWEALSPWFARIHQ